LRISIVALSTPVRKREETISSTYVVDMGAEPPMLEPRILS